jgi:hypothetical protein
MSGNRARRPPGCVRVGLGLPLPGAGGPRIFPHRRALLGASQSLSEVAHACGFIDYTHFARKFRHRFGHAPGAHDERDGRSGNGTARTAVGGNTLGVHEA